MHFIPRVVPYHGAMPPEPGRRALGIFSSLVALLLVSCGAGGDDPVGVSLEPASAAGVQVDIRLRDPSADGWPSEVLHDLAKPVLHHLVGSVAGLPGSQAPSTFLAPGFRGSTALRPSDSQGKFSARGKTPHRPVLWKACRFPQYRRMTPVTTPRTSNSSQKMGAMLGFAGWRIVPPSG